jgi:hypothetical protein
MGVFRQSLPQRHGVFGQEIPDKNAEAQRRRGAKISDYVDTHSSCWEPLVGNLCVSVSPCLACPVNNLAPLVPISHAHRLLRYLWYNGEQKVEQGNKLCLQDVLYHVWMLKQGG